MSLARSQVRRVQDVGGRTSLSLTFDPTAAGHRNYIEPHSNPVLASVQPPPVPQPARRRFQNAVPVQDQVVITSSDDARLNSMGLHHVERRSSIRRVTVGGVSGSSIVFA
jgi:hypothetical protein